MANSEDFVAFVLDLLEPVGPVQARRMFGGHGVYAQGVMFGLVDDDELFLKTDEETRARFVDAGCRMWTYAATVETNYYQPPAEAHDDPEAMAPWARMGLDAALRAQARKAAKAKRPKQAVVKRAAKRAPKAVAKTATKPKRAAGAARSKRGKGGRSPRS